MIIREREEGRVRDRGKEEGWDGWRGGEEREGR